MKKIFYVMGKSASGKDTIYKKILEQMPRLSTVTLYTTRPMRDGEKDGVEYYFTDEKHAVPGLTPQWMTGSLNGPAEAA